MAVRLGSGEFTFEVNENWAKLPEEITLGDVAAVGVDRQNRVYAFNRGEHPVAVFDAKGNLLRTLGEGVFHRPHGVHMGPDDTIYLTDDGDHTVRKCTLDGKVLMTLGIPGEPKPYMSGERSTAAPTPLCPRKVTSTSRTVTEMRGSTNIPPTASS
jgi:DNA-binding beta-propeller fold protein YncE